jgi:hypothetical protein
MLDELGKYVIATPYPFVVDLEKSEGMYLATVDGQRLFDWAGYFGSKLVAHNHPRLYAPDYVKRLVCAANNKIANPDFLTPECLEYYRLLYRVAPRSLQLPSLEVYAVNSGAEAVENMMKYLVAKFNAKRKKLGTGLTNRRFLYFDQAFHGRTVFALQVTQTADPVATRDFHGLGSVGNVKLPFPAVNTSEPDEANERRTDDALRMVESALSQMAEEVVAIIVEPIQGAGGQRVALPRFFTGLSELAGRYGEDVRHRPLRPAVPADGGGRREEVRLRRGLHAGAAGGHRRPRLDVGRHARRHGARLRGDEDRRGGGPDRAGGAEGGASRRRPARPRRSLRRQDQQRPRDGPVPGLLARQSRG